MPSYPTFEYGTSALPAGIALPVAEFVEADPEALVEKLRTFCKQVRGKARAGTSRSETVSWGTNIPKLQRLLRDPRLSHLFVMLEALVPHAHERIDGLLIGSTAGGMQRIVVLELKAWSSVQRVQGFSDRFMPIPSPLRARTPAIHPSAQVRDYRSQLRSLLTPCHDDKGEMLHCAVWLYRMHGVSESPLTESMYSELLREAPIFGAADDDRLKSLLLEVAPCRPDVHFLGDLNSATVRQSRTAKSDFAEHLVGLSRELSVDQAEVIGQIIETYDPTEHRAVIVRWGSGCRKTFLPLLLMREFQRRDIGALYAARPPAIRNHHRALFPDSRFMFTDPLAFARNGRASQYDVLVIDEAHRLKMPDHVVNCVKSAKLTIFFVDDNHVIIPSELPTGSTKSKWLSNACARAGVSARTMDLFGDRSGGVEEYTAWVDHVMRIGGRAPYCASSPYHFELVNSPQELEAKLRGVGGVGGVGGVDGSWRILAGYCCFDQPDSKIRTDALEALSIPEYGYARPWQGDPMKMMPGTDLYDAAVRWASDSGAQGSIGGVYSTPNIDFDYVGVILGRDLVIRNDVWTFQERHHSPADKTFHDDGAYEHAAKRCAQNINRILLTRGRKGCFVFFQDEETKRYVQKHCLQ